MNAVELAPNVSGLRSRLRWRAVRSGPELSIVVPAVVVPTRTADRVRERAARGDVGAAYLKSVAAAHAARNFACRGRVEGFTAMAGEERG